MDPALYLSSQRLLRTVNYMPKFEELATCLQPSSCTLADKSTWKVCPMLVIGSRILKLKFDECVLDGDFSYSTKEIQFNCFILTHFEHL